MTLRALLIQRAARLQEWPALTVHGWDSLRYPAFRNRIEGVALGLMAGAPALGAPVFSRTGGPWDWASEVASACCGLIWSPSGVPVPLDILGGPRFNDEAGRQPYHDRDHQLTDATPVTAALDHGELLRRLQRLNSKLGWDHATAVTLPMDQLGTPELRSALWSALYAGSHAILVPGKVKEWDPATFKGILE